MEDMSVFKSFLRGLMRQLKELKKALDEQEFERAENIVDNLIDDTQKGIED